MPKPGGTAWGVLVALVLGVHLVTLYWPGSPEPGPVLFPHVDKVVHFIAFGVPAFLLWLGWRRWWTVALLALHAPVSELLQHRLLPYRGGDPWDAAADLAGVVVGVLVAEACRRRFPARFPHNTTHA